MDNKIGNYKNRESCRLCNSENLVEVINFGEMPLAGGFLTKENINNENHYPLVIDYCNDCYLVQVRNVISVDVLFREKYFFFSSSIKTLVHHFREFANEIYRSYLKEKNNPLVLEIGCNDGVLLNPLNSLGVKTIGVDPATNVIDNINESDIIIYNDCFTHKLSRKISKEHGKVDIILSCYSFAHIDNMIDVIKGIKKILKDDGLLIVEIYYFGTLIDEMQYDNIYHEHMSYYSITTLSSFFNRYEMEIFNIKYFPKVRSGSTRFYVKNKGYRKEKISSRYNELINHENNKGYNDINLINNFADKVKGTKVELLKTMKSLKKDGKTIVGYGASGRGTMISNYCGIDKNFIDYVIDDAPEKHGFYTPGTHLEIKPWESIFEFQIPDYVIVLAWGFIDEIINKRKDYLQMGGKFIVPLPVVKIISEKN